MLLNTVFSKWTDSVGLYELTQNSLTAVGYKRLMGGAIKSAIETYNAYTVSFFEELSRLGDKLDVVLAAITTRYDNSKEDSEGANKIKIEFKATLKEVARYTYFDTFMTGDLKRALGVSYSGEEYLKSFKLSLESIKRFSEENADIDSIVEEKLNEMCDLLKDYTISKTRMDVHLFKNIVVGWSFQVIWAFSAQRYNLGKVPGSEALIKTLYGALDAPFNS